MRAAAPPLLQRVINVTAMQQVRVIVRGRVQGVGFRYHTQQVAQEIGCVGWVRNLSDGTVECVAQGDDGQFERLVAFLQVGPPAAHVESVDVSYTDALDAFDSFTITR